MKKKFVVFFAVITFLNGCNSSSLFDDIDFNEPSTNTEPRSVMATGQVLNDFASKNGLDASLIRPLSMYEIVPANTSAAPQLVCLTPGQIETGQPVQFRIENVIDNYLYEFNGPDVEVIDYIDTRTVVVVFHRWGYLKLSCNPLFTSEVAHMFIYVEQAIDIQGPTKAYVGETKTYYLKDFHRWAYLDSDWSEPTPISQIRSGWWDVIPKVNEVIVGGEMEPVCQITFTEPGEKRVGLDFTYMGGNGIVDITWKDINVTVLDFPSGINNINWSMGEPYEMTYSIHDWIHLKAICSDLTFEANYPVASDIEFTLRVWVKVTSVTPKEDHKIRIPAGTTTAKLTIPIEIIEDMEGFPEECPIFIELRGGLNIENDDTYTYKIDFPDMEY